jgi:hypothetical protein
MHMCVFLSLNGPPIITLQVHSSIVSVCDVLAKLGNLEQKKSIKLQVKHTHAKNMYSTTCMLMYVVNNKNFSSTSCICRAHISMAGVTNIAIFFTNQNVMKFEHEINTQYKNIYHQESICRAD